MPIGISAIEYALPSQSVSLHELAEEQRLSSSPEQLHSLGFDRCYVSSVPAETLAYQAATALLERGPADRDDVDLLVYAGAIASSHEISSNAFLSNFNYPAAKLQFELGLLRAGVVGISQSGCVGLTNAVKLATDYLRSNDTAKRVLCVGADVLPSEASREILYNVISDGACALLVERDCGSNKILAHGAVTKGYYWDCISRKYEIMAAYFPTARNLVAEVLVQGRCRPEELRLLIPHNVSL